MNRFIELELLGRGTYSEVYKAMDRLSKRHVALKKITINREEGIPFTSVREIALMKNLRHKNILPLLDVVYEKGTIVLVIQFMEFDLKRFMAEHSVDIIPFVKQLLQGVRYLHSLNIIHRDLKPQNILVDREHNLKIADFGLARSMSFVTPNLSKDVVTLWYRAPEILERAEYSVKIDMWSVGCIIAEMIDNVPLFQGKDNTAQLELLRDIFSNGIEIYICRRFPDIPAYLLKVLTGCLKYEAANRYDAENCLMILNALSYD